MENEQKQFFLPGDTVTIKQNIANKPEMIVVKKVSKMIKNGHLDGVYFQGILCR